MEKGIFLCKEANTSSHDKDDDVWSGSAYNCISFIQSVLPFALSKITIKSKQNVENYNAK